MTARLRRPAHRPASRRRPATQPAGRSAGVRAAWIVAAAWTLLACLAGCSSVPTTGTIQQGPVVDSGESTQFIRVIAAPPSPGASPEEVVRGFLEANASLEDDHGIARHYLTPEASARWAPQQRTTIYSLSSMAVTGAGPTITTSLDVIGELLPDGSLQTIDPARPRQIVMTVQMTGPQERNLPVEWRITDPPDELLVSDGDLRRAYREQQVYFLADTTQTLVPDARLLPVVGPTLPTALAERVLAGPSAWLAPGVEQSPLPGTALAFGSVPVNDGVATVELTDQALAASPEQRRALAAELTWTLTELPEVRAVEILVSGGPYQVPGLPVLLDRSTWQSIAPDKAILGPAGTDRPPAFVLREGRVVRVTEAGETSIPLPAEVKEPVAGLAVSLDERRASVVDAARAVLWIFQFDNRSSARQFRVTGDSSGSFAPDGSFWYTNGGAVQRVTTTGDVTRVSVANAPAGGIDAVRVARDGVRVAVTADGALLLGVLQRDAEGTASIVSLRPVVGGLSRVRDVSWRSSTDLDVLGSLAEQGRQLVRVGVGTGTTQGLRAPNATTDITAAPASTTLAVAADRVVYGNVGLQWRQQGAGEAVAYPG